MRRCLGATPGRIKQKIPPDAICDLIFFAHSDVGDVVQRDIIIVVVIFKDIVVDIHIDRIIIIVQNDIIVAFGLLLGLQRRGIFGIGGDHAALAGVEFNDFPGIRAHDRVLVQVIEPFSSGRAKTFCTPFFVGHGNPLDYLLSRIDDSGHVPYEVGTVKGFSRKQGRSMAEYVLPGSPPVTLNLRRSGRARRISLRISQLDGKVTLTLPRGVKDAEALDFARSKGDWIRGHLENRVDDIPVRHGVHLPIQGAMHQVVATTGRRVTVRDGQVGVPGDATGSRLQAWLRELARDRLVAASDHYAARLGRPYARITLRDTRSRWGSCSSAGGLNYSWRLILAPPEVLRYVAAHEVAHLAEMNHSAAFWATVERLHGPYQSQRTWLRKQGNELHRYRF